MNGRNFRDLLEAKWAEKKFLCVGLDTDFERIPEAVRKESVRETIVAFNRAIVDATKDIVCAYKPNSAFYEAHGDEGWKALRETIQYILDQAPDVPVILDAKRGDIGSTNAGYITSAFDHLNADAITVQPYPGKEALQPFLDRKEKGIIIWCRTSNHGGGEFQDLKVGHEPLYKVVAEHVAKEWNGNGNCGLVVGATYPNELREVRAIAGDMPILIPGVGVQGGEIGKTVAAGKDPQGRGMIISVSRALIFASDKADFAEAARAKAEELYREIREAL